MRWLIRSTAWRRTAQIERFRRACETLALTQSAVLLEKIRRNQDCEYGRAHQFDRIRTVADFRAAVPLNCFEDLQHHVNRILAGEGNILFSNSDPVLMFAATSGTTDKPKHIPVTRSFLEEYRRDNRLWNAFCFREHPRMIAGKILPIVASTSESRAPCGLPVGSISGLIAAKQRLAVRHLYAIPPEITAIPNSMARYYTLMRLAIPQKVTYLSSPNPSTLLLVASLVNERKEDIIRDIFDGKLVCEQEVPELVRRTLAYRLKPDRGTATRLETIVKTTGSLLPKEYWASLHLIGCWKGGPMHLYLKQLPSYFGLVAIRDLGLLASEGRMSLPISDVDSAGALNIQSHFFEFMPQNGKETSAKHGTLLAHELEVGQEYFIVITTSSGLYRYEINDLIRVEGWFHGNPLIKFLNKGCHIASITGEKLSEYQVVKAVEEVFCPRGSCTFVMSPVWGNPPHYVLLLEEGELAGIVTSFEACLDRLDKRLQELNCEYSSKRRSGRLGPVSLALVECGSLKPPSPIQHSEQQKAVYLKPELDYHRKLNILHQFSIDTRHLEVHSA